MLAGIVLDWRVRLLCSAFTIMVTAMCVLASSSSAAQGEALLEVYVENQEWSPSQGWPPEHESLSSTDPIWWKTLVKKGDVAPDGGMSLEQVAALSGVPRKYLTGLLIKNRDGEQFGLTRAEALGGTQGPPYFQAEGGEASASAISFVVPPGSNHSGQIASGVGGALVLVLTIEGGLIELAPIDFSPEEPSGGGVVEFAQPGFSGGVLPGAPHTYEWVFGDGTTSNLAAPRHRYPSTGESPTTYYEASVEVVLWNFKAEEIAAGTKVVTVPVSVLEAAQTPPVTPTAPATPPVAPTGLGSPPTTPTVPATPPTTPTVPATPPTTPTVPATPPTTPTVSPTDTVPATSVPNAALPTSSESGATAPGTKLGSRPGSEAGRGRSRTPPPRSNQGTGSRPSASTGGGGREELTSAGGGEPRSGSVQGPDVLRGVGPSSQGGETHVRHPNPGTGSPPAQSAKPAPQRRGLLGVIVNSVAVSLPAAVLAGPEAGARLLLGANHSSAAAAQPLRSLGFALGIGVVLLIMILGALGELRPRRHVG